MLQQVLEMIAFNFKTSLISKKLKHREISYNTLYNLFLTQVCTVKLLCAQRYCIHTDNTIYVTLRFPSPSHSRLNRTV
jgi:hypothetical protein